MHRTIFRDSAENQHAHIHSLHTSAAQRWRIFLLRTPRNCWTNWIFQKRLIAGSVGSHTRARTHPISCGVLRGTTMMKMNVRAEYGIAKMPKKLCLSLTVQKQGAEFFPPGENAVKPKLTGRFRANSLTLGLFSLCTTLSSGNLSISEQ